MKTTAASPLHPEPTHDEIALSAFLLWEKEGRQSGCEMTCWLQAEAQLRAFRQQKVEAAAQSAKSWTTQSTAARTKTATSSAAPQPAPKAKLPAAPKLATTVARATTVKPAPAATSAATRPASRTSLKAAR